MFKIIFTLLCSISILLNSADARKPHNPYNAQVMSHSLSENSLHQNPFNYQGIRKKHEHEILEDFRKKRNNINEPLTLEAIQEAMETFKSAVQNYTIEEINELYKKSPKKFQAALNTKPGIEAFQNLLTSISEGSNSLDEEQEEIIRLCIQNISSENFTNLNFNDGQTLVHKFTPLHWHSEIIKALEKRTRLDIQTFQGDKFPGTTMAHSVASILRNKKNLHDMINNNPKFTKMLEVHIQRGIEFLVGWCTKYPESIASLSKNSNNQSGLSFWNLLAPQHRTLIYQKLTPEIIQIINAELTNAWKENKLSLDQYLRLKTEFPEQRPSTENMQ